VKALAEIAGGIAGGIGLLLLLLSLLGASPPAKRGLPPATLPIFGTKLAELPPGEGKAIADRACLRCHSADMLRQQRLTEKQWTASVAKMSGWGAEIRDDEEAVLAAYLAKNFSPDAGLFLPAETRPLPAH
jgi:mono/diheme cytochrome c family protein